MRAPASPDLVLIRIPEAARLMSATVFGINELIRLGRLRSVSIGNRTLISRDAIREFVKGVRPIPPRSIEEQYDVYVDLISTRKRRPVTKKTLGVIHGYWRKWIHPAIGQLDVSQVRNKQVRDLVAHLVEGGGAAYTIGVIVRCVKGIVASAVDENGDEIYPVKWNDEFIDAPTFRSSK
jgi:excisionase family DNA binding protein